MESLGLNSLLTSHPGGEIVSDEMEPEVSAAMLQESTTGEGTEDATTAMSNAETKAQSTDEAASPSSPRAVGRAFYDFVQNLEGKSLDQSMWAPRHSNIAKTIQSRSRVPSRQRSPVIMQQPKTENDRPHTLTAQKLMEQKATRYIDAATQTLLTGLMHVELSDEKLQTLPDAAAGQFAQSEQQALAQRPDTLWRPLKNSSRSLSSTRRDDFAFPETTLDRTLDTAQSQLSKSGTPESVHDGGEHVRTKVVRFADSISSEKSQRRLLAPHQRALLSSEPSSIRAGDEVQTTTVKLPPATQDKEAEPGEIKLGGEGTQEQATQQAGNKQDKILPQGDNIAYISASKSTTSHELDREKDSQQASQQAEVVQKKFSAQKEEVVAPSLPKPVSLAHKRTAFDPTAYSSRRQASNPVTQEDRTNQTYFNSWGTVERRERPAAKIRTVILTALPPHATPAFVASVVFGGALEQIHLRGERSAAVRFLDGDDARKFYDENANGLVYGKGPDGREKVAWVHLGKDVDVGGGQLGEWIKMGRTRCIKATHVAKDITLDNLILFASKNRVIEGVEDSIGDNKARIVTFRFAKIEHAVQFRGVLARDEEWEHCNISFATDPCEIATGPRIMSSDDH